MIGLRAAFFGLADRFLLVRNGYGGAYRITRGGDILNVVDGDETDIW